MKRVLIVEDQPVDLKLATSVLESVDAVEMEARTGAESARAYLDEALEGKRPLPDLVILDLDLGYESGFELLRHWHSEPRLKQIEMVVWTVLGKQQQEMCKLFGVQRIVAKWEGTAGLKSAIEAVRAPAP